MSIELIRIQTAGKGFDRDAFMVKVEGQVKGFIEKIPNTRTEQHPWKAFGARYNPATQGFQYDATKYEYYYGRGAKNAALEFVKGL